MTFTRRVKTCSSGVLAVALFASSAVYFAGPATADDQGGANPNTYSLAASAIGLDVTVTDNSAPLIQQYEAGDYGADASLDSLQQSESDAGAPYSPVLAGLPPLVNGLGANGLLPPLPPLPGYVKSNYPSDPDVRQTQAIYDIHAVSGAYHAAGTVNLGVSTAQATSSNFFANAATTADANGTVTATATATASLLNLGDLLDLGDVTSTVTMTEQGSKTPTVTGSTRLGTITLLGKVTGLLNGGLSLLGIKLGLATPVTSTLLPTLNKLLKAAGISISYVPVTYGYTDGTSSSTLDAHKTIQSVASGALEVSVIENVPSQGVVTVNTILGKSTVSATNTLGEAVAPPTSPPISPTPPAVSNGGTGSGSLPTVSAPLPPGTSVIPIGSGGGQPVTSPSGPTTHTELVASIFGPTVESFYLILVLGGLVALGMAGLTNLLGVRLAFRRK